MKEKSKKAIIPIFALLVVAMLVLLAVWMYNGQVEVIETEDTYEAVVGETFSIELTNPDGPSGFASSLYDKNYDYNYSYQWNVSGASNQTMLRHMNTIRNQNKCVFEYNASEAGNMTLTFEYRIRNEYIYRHTATIVITED